MNLINEYSQRFQNVVKASAMFNNEEANITAREEMDGPPLRRPTTPMTNLSSTSNSQLMIGGKFLIFT